MDIYRSLEDMFLGFQLLYYKEIKEKNIEKDIKSQFTIQVSKEMQEERVISRRHELPVVCNANKKANKMKTEIVIGFGIMGGSQ